MAYPTIVFNASTGTDTAASGAGPATAVTGTGASLNATTAVDLSADSPDLSGVATDGSACLWVQTSSGRQFSQITATDNSLKTVTVNTAYSVTESSRNWAIGGKRATWDDTDSRTLFDTNGAEGNWTIETETDQTLTSVIYFKTYSDTTIGYVTVQGSGGINKTVDQSTFNQSHFDFLGSTTTCTNFRFLNFQHSGGNSGGSFAFGFGSGVHLLEHCVFGDATNKLGYAFARRTGTPFLKVLNCEIKYCSNTSTACNMGSLYGIMINCSIHDNAGVGIRQSSFAAIVIGCLIYNNGGSGILQGGSGLAQSKEITHNVIHGNAGDGIALTGSLSADYAVILNNVITANGGYGINAHADTSTIYSDHNNFGTGATANASGAVNNMSLGASDLQVDPQFTDAANADFSTGSNMRNAGYPSSLQSIGDGQSNTFAFVDIGIQQEMSGGGVRQVNIRGGADQ